MNKFITIMLTAFCFSNIVSMQPKMLNQTNNMVNNAEKINFWLLNAIMEKQGNGAQSLQNIDAQQQLLGKLYAQNGGIQGLLIPSINNSQNKEHIIAMLQSEDQNLKLFLYQTSQGSKFDVTPKSLLAEIAKSQQQVVEGIKTNLIAFYKSQNKHLNSNVFPDVLYEGNGINGLYQAINGAQNKSQIIEQLKSILPDTILFRYQTQSGLVFSVTPQIILSKLNHEQKLEQNIKLQPIAQYQDMHIQAPQQINAKMENLIKPTIPDLLQKYNQNATKSAIITQTKGNNNPFRGRQQSPDWIQATFGKTEQDLTTEFASLPPIQPYPISEIDQMLQIAEQSIKPNGEPITFYITESDISKLHETKEGGDENTMIQLASQSNYRESPGKFDVTVSQYVKDETQGPKGAVEAAAASIYRHAQEEKGDLTNALSDINIPTLAKCYHKGYLEPWQLSKQEYDDAYKSLEQNIGKLKILPQWVQYESTGNTGMQVFSSAPSYQGKLKPQSCAISDLLVSEQYAAIAKIALIKAIQTKKPVNVFYTGVGQGVFNNPPKIMQTAFKKVADVLKGYAGFVNVYVTYYGNPNQSSCVQAVTALQSDDIKLQEKKLIQ